MDASMTSKQKRAMERRYNSDEVADIIRLSLQDEGRRSDNSVDYEELLTIAKDMGVESEQVVRAVQLLEQEQQTRDKEQYLWQRFRSHVMVFAAINLFLVALNVFGDSDRLWSLNVIFVWGLFLLGHYISLRYAPQFVESAMQRSRGMVGEQYQNLFDHDDRVIFSTRDPMGLTDTQGMLSIEGDILKLEYQTKDAMIGMIKTSVKLVEIPVSELSSARIDRRFWRAELVLQGKSMRVFSNAPGAQRGQLQLKINRQSTQAANELLDEIRARLAK